MAANVPLVERVDIHKSCKALETIVNAFNDYCQAAEALALVQKKLARALKDAVGTKATNELAGNALSAAASLLDSLAEVDAKFVKVIDKECEGTSNELRKWFKKLAKEERNHDEKVSTANTKIKQAGLAYEKKAKRKDRDAGEEHTRYVNLLSVVGPEMSQERYNHTLFVTQRHTATLYNVAASISRAADAEWTRACDCVRKFSPVIGRIGECRAYLEGGWMLSMPDGNGDSDDKNSKDANVTAIEQDSNRIVDEMGVRVGKVSSGSAETDSSVYRSTAPAFTPATSSSSSTPPTSVMSYQMGQSPPSAPPSLPSRAQPSSAPPTSYSSGPLGRFNTDSVRSIESLSSFPTPPTHFPLPAMVQLPSSPLAQSASERSKPPNGDGEKATSNILDGTYGRSVEFDRPAVLSESPRVLPTPVERTSPVATNETENLLSSGQSMPPSAAALPRVDGKDGEGTGTGKMNPMGPPPSPRHRRRDSAPSGVNEIGIQDRKISGTIERTESVISTSSIVASMRDKWVRGDVSSPPPPRERDIPRVSTKVSDLASRYVPSTDANAAPLSPKATGQTSPTSDRVRQVSGQNTKRDENTANAQINQNTAAAPTNPSTTASEVDLARRRRRIEELEDLERREQAQALRAREREIEMQTKELERERDRIRALSNVPPSGSGSGTGAVRAHQQHSYSMVNLVPTSSVGREAPVRPVSQYGEPPPLSASPSSSSSTSNPLRPDHAPYCGCQTCSASQYSNPPSHVQLVPQPRVQKEKPKGWMRRLSMPVVANAFSSPDSKKVYGIGAGISGGSLPYIEQDRTGGIGNVRPRKISFGRR